MADSNHFQWPLRPDGWDLLTPGTTVTVVKRKHNGPEAVIYPGTVVNSLADDPWVEIEAHWTAGTIVQGPVTFEVGDVLREFFSSRHPFNAFAVYSPELVLKGWYANVTFPSWVEVRGEVLTVHWQDLWLDVVANVDGEIINLDDDELAATGLLLSDPDFHAAIVSARDSLVELVRQSSVPFGPSVF